MKIKLSLSLLFALLFTVAFAQEHFTISTYYPSPFGNYRELRAQRVAIGDSYINTSNYIWGNQIDADADLVVEGNVGIGTLIPTTPIHIEGPATGAIRIVDGNQGLGKVLMSDADGVGTWQPPFNTVRVQRTTNTNTNSLSWVNMPDMSATITTYGGGLFILFSATSSATGSYRGGDYRILVDGQDVLNGRYYTWKVGHNSNRSLTSFSWYEPVTAGAHTVIIQWRSSDGHQIEQKATVRPCVLIVSEQ